MTRSLLFAGWALVTPPVPLGTELPPVDEWSVAATYNTTEECERARQLVRARAGGTVAADPNASAFQVAAALGQLQSKCMEYKTPEAAKPVAKVVEPVVKNVEPAAKPAKTK